MAEQLCLILSPCSVQLIPLYPCLLQGYC